MDRIGFGFLGTTLDAHGGWTEKRHNVWRPTVSFGLDRSLGLHALEIWHTPKFKRLADIIKSDIERLPQGAKVSLRVTDIKDPWNFEEVYGFLFDFVNSYEFDPSKHEYFVHLTTGTHVAQICLFLLTESRHFPAKLVQTNKRGIDEARKDIEIVDLDLSRYDKLAQRFEAKLGKDLEILKSGINTRNKEFNELIQEIEFVARSSREPIVLLGPTGSGKSQLAKQIFLLKASQHRLEGSFVDINCATIRGEQAMSALFGHVKGAFTGALSKRDGLLKKANHGLLFLDEIGELGLDEQAMLLRALEEKRFFPFGSDVEEESNFQLIVGTNRNLLEQVAIGAFREDLLHRINTWCFWLPALKDRREDIEPNLDLELKKFEASTGRRISFSSEAKNAYLDYALSPQASWSGNFRDLNASVIRMGTMAEQGRITTEVVTAEVRRLITGEKSESVRAPSGSDDYIIRQSGVHPEALDLFDKPQLAEVLTTLSSSQTIADAGRKLFAVSRKARLQFNDSDRIRKYLARFGLDARQLVDRSS